MSKILLLVAATLCVFTPCLSAADRVERRKSVSQYGITWTFERPRPCGQFITGDWWVVGPVTVVAVDPAPGPAEADNTVVRKNMYGVTGMQADATMRNGSMIVETTSGKQGYDSRLKNYDPALSARFPLSLQPGTSLISTVSACMDDEKAEHLFHKRMWSSEKKGFFALRSAAVLTVLRKPPPADAFRPPYAGARKPMYTYSQLHTDKLLKLEPAEGMPSWEEFERYLQRPWLDHTHGWLHQYTGPHENQVNYGREFARITGMAGLMLNTDAPLERKKKLLIGLTQLGIDLFGVVEAGRPYHADGGHYSGRKWPIVFAGVMLGEEKMARPSKYVQWAEDAQTYYGTGWAGQTALYQIVVHTGPKPPHEHLPPSEWDWRHKRAEGYRIVNGTAWPATALVVRLMGLVNEWGHDAFFEYVDRWMADEDLYAGYADVYDHKRHRMEGKTFDAFTNNMWAAYRHKAPEPDWAGNPRVWVWLDGHKGEWRPNPKPTDAAAKRHAEMLRTGEQAKQK